MLVRWTSWLVLAGVASVACRSNQSSPDPSPATSSAAESGAAASSSAKLARVVFVDQEDCCQCTRERINASFAALQGALAGRATQIPVARVHADSQAAIADEYRQKQPFMVLPAIYLMDESGNVLQLLQGELSQAQLSAALERP